MKMIKEVNDLIESILDSSFAMRVKIQHDEETSTQIFFTRNGNDIWLHVCCNDPIIAKRTLESAKGLGLSTSQKCTEFIGPEGAESMFQVIASFMSNDCPEIISNFLSIAGARVPLDVQKIAVRHVLSITTDIKIEN